MFIVVPKVTGVFIVVSKVTGVFIVVPKVTGGVYCSAKGDWGCLL